MKNLDLINEAIKLHQAGNSYGEIGKQLDVPKATIYRWLTEGNTNNGTIETPDGTEIGTQRNEFLSSNDTNEITGFVSETENNKTRNDSPRNRNEIAKIEIRKAELEHEYQMEELEFRKQIYLDKQNKQNMSQIETVEAEHKDKIDEIMLKIEDLNKQNQNLKSELSAQIDSKKNQDIETVFPKEINIEIRKLIEKYFSYQKKYCTPNVLKKLLDKSYKVRSQSFRWALKNKILIDSLNEIRILSMLISDIEIVFYEEENEDTEFYLNIDPEVKVELKSWLKNKS